MTTLLALSISLVLATTAWAADDRESKTQLEQFLSKTGVLIVKVFHPVGTIHGLHGTSLELTAVTLYEPGREAQRRQGIKIEVSGGGRLETKHTSFLDLDEIDALLKALDYIKRAMGEWASAQRDYTEMQFITKGGFKVGFFTNKKEGRVTGFVSSGKIREATTFLHTSNLVLLYDRVKEGMAYLQGKKSAGTSL